MEIFVDELIEKCFEERPNRRHYYRKHNRMFVICSVRLLKFTTWPAYIYIYIYKQKGDGVHAWESVVYEGRDDPRRPP